jgi:small-conductance mechanosensitive channel
MTPAHSIDDITIADIRAKLAGKPASISRLRQLFGVGETKANLLLAKLEKQQPATESRASRTKTALPEAENSEAQDSAISDSQAVLAQEKSKMPKTSKTAKAAKTPREKTEGGFLAGSRASLVLEFLQKVGTASLTEIVAAVAEKQGVAINKKDRTFYRAVGVVTCKNFKRVEKGVYSAERLESGN